MVIQGGQFKPDEWQAGEAAAMLLDDDEAERKCPLAALALSFFSLLEHLPCSFVSFPPFSPPVRAKQDEKRVVDEKRAKGRAEKTEARRQERGAKRPADENTSKAKKPRAPPKKKGASAVAAPLATPVSFSPAPGSSPAAGYSSPALAYTTPTASPAFRSAPNGLSAPY